MKLIEIKDKKKYDDFVVSQKHSQFLQSWEWGEFQESMGSKIFRYGLQDGEELIFVMTLVKKVLLIKKSYFYSPRIGIKNLSEETLIFLFEEIGKIAKKENVIFFRFDPINQLQITNYKLRIIQTIDIQPSKTLILNISKSEEDLLENMHQKTRYNIRLANKKGVEIIEAGKDDFDEWWKIMEETCKRDGFRLHSKKYYKKMLFLCHSERSEESRQSRGKRSFDLRSQDDKSLVIKLIVAKYNPSSSSGRGGKVIAGNIISFFGDMAIYVHGASSNEYRNVMAPYALQWYTIKEAKKHGCKYYDFYGIDEKKWPGVTRFKKGFGGDEINYPGTFDLIFKRSWYNVYKLIRKLRRMI